MKDVLEHLAKLPQRCAAIVDGEVSFIRRGAKAPDTAFIAADHVDRWNRDHGVTEAQVKAMIVGVTLGWDVDGADPDTHAAASEDEVIGGPFEYHYHAEIALEIVIEAQNEQLAAEEARLRLNEVCTWLDSGDPIPGQVVGFAPSDTLDLVDTTDPRP